MPNVANVAWLVEMKGSKYLGENLTLLHGDLSQIYYWMA